MNSSKEITLDYKRKYIKYKSKYLNFLDKTQKINFVGKIKLVNIKCDDENKILCPPKSVNLGLCVKNKSDCKKIDARSF